MKKTGSFGEFAQYSLLNILGMLGLSCYILADTFFVSRGLGADGLAALNLAIPVYSFLHGSGLMIGMGGGIRYSIYRGQRDQAAACRVFSGALWLAAGFAVFFVLLGAFFSSDIAFRMGASGAAYGMSKTYLQVILLFAPAFLLNNVLLCFVRNDGAPRLAMAAMLAGSFSNIALDYLFIFPCRMGIFGAVLATGLAPIVSMTVLLPFFIQKRNGFHATACRGVGRLFWGILSAGVPSLIAEASSGVVMITFNAQVLQLEGNVGVAAYGIIANLSLVVLSIDTGLAQGIQPLVSRNTGEGNASGARAVLRYAVLAMLVVSVLIYAGVFFKASWIAGVFHDGHNQRLQEIAVAGLKRYFTACPFAGWNIVLSMYFTAAGYERPAHVLSMLRGFAIVLPMVFLLSRRWGMTGVWCSFPAAELLTGIAGLGFYLYFANVCHRGDQCQSRLSSDCRGK